MTTAASVGQKLWNYCNVLRDDGLSYGDYLEQLTYLLFLKMMDERSRPPYTLLPDYRPPPIPEGYVGRAWWRGTGRRWRATTGAPWRRCRGSRGRWG